MIGDNEFRGMWTQGRETWLDWVSTQTWRSDAVGEKAREVMQREAERTTASTTPADQGTADG